MLQKFFIYDQGGTGFVFSINDHSDVIEIIKDDMNDIRSAFLSAIQMFCRETGDELMQILCAASQLVFLSSHDSLYTIAIQSTYEISHDSLAFLLEDIRDEINLTLPKKIRQHLFFSDSFNIITDIIPVIKEKCTTFIRKIRDGRTQT